MNCAVCNRVGDERDLTPTYVITEGEKRKDVRICRVCVEQVCDIPKGQRFPLRSADEMVRLPDSFYTKS